MPNTPVAVQQQVASSNAIHVVIILSLIVIAIALLVVIVIKLKKSKQGEGRHSSLPQAPSGSSAEIPVLFVVMTERKDFSDDPVKLLQNASAYWTGTEEEWEKGPKSANVPMEMLLKTDIASLLAEDLLLITYKTKCKKNHIPQNRFNIQDFFHHKKDLQPTYYKLPRHEHSIMDKFIKYFKG